jgi:hypothetical protein
MKLVLPDLLEPRALPAAIAQALAIVGVLVACAGTARVWQAEQRMALATADHEAAGLLAGGRAAVAAPIPSAAGTPRTARSRSERAPPLAVDAANAERVALARFLSVDWNHRLLLVEQAGAGLVSLTGLKVDANRGTLELRGDTASLEQFESMGRLLLQAGVSTVQLSRHETVLRPGGARLSFVAMAEWTR